jgi:hypothetical protein
MKTDQAIYTYLSTGPEAFRILTGGLELSGPYRFRSVTFKALERRADGVCEPTGDAEPTYVVEFQAQPEEGAWYNLLTKVGLIGEASPAAEVRGILIFLHERDDPGRPAGISHEEGPFHAVYLNRFLPDLLAQEPDNPYVAVFAPLVIERDEELKRQAPRLWQTIQSAPIPEPIRLRLAEILEFWFFERFRYLNPEEVWTMLNQLTPLEETVAYRVDRQSRAGSRLCKYSFGGRNWARLSYDTLVPRLCLGTASSRLCRQPAWQHRAGGSAQRRQSRQALGAGAEPRHQQRTGHPRGQ